MPEVKAGGYPDMPCREKILTPIPVFRWARGQKVITKSAIPATSFI